MQKLFSYMYIFTAITPDTSVESVVTLIKRDRGVGQNGEGGNKISSKKSGPCYLSDSKIPAPGNHVVGLARLLP